ncbi:MAG: Uma2 family endonuclease [Bacteroidetes bacterium]|nr:MAG: Uma2 family endonuclease [Bacteroidota bacterium]
MENEIKEPAPKYNYVSPDEYLEMERASTEKHEYYNGYVIAMSGARLKHNQIAVNLYAKIGSYLDGKKCQVLPAVMRVATPNRDAYIYPDATIVCGEPLLEDEKFDTLLNPSVVFEIWSPSTQKNDMGYKLLFYQHIHSLKEYIMIDSAKRFAQVVRKQPDGAWRFEDISGTHDALFISIVNLNLSFDDIYRNTGL